MRNNTRTQEQEHYQQHLRAKQWHGRSVRGHVNTLVMLAPRVNNKTLKHNVLGLGLGVRVWLLVFEGFRVRVRVRRRVKVKGRVRGRGRVRVRARMRVRVRVRVRVLVRASTTHHAQSVCEHIADAQREHV